jgi:hypothetical protein
MLVFRANLHHNSEFHAGFKYLDRGEQLQHRASGDGAARTGSGLAVESRAAQRGLRPGALPIIEDGPVTSYEGGNVF